MSPHCRDMWAPSTSNATALAKPNTISLLEAVEKEVVHNELVFSALGLIGRFRGVWPSLSALHKWIVDHWEPIVDDSVQIYLHARGFFVLVFQTMEDRNKILDLTNFVQGLAGGLVGVNEGGFQEGCSSFQVAKGGVQKMEDGPSSQGGLNVGMVEGIQPENQCWDSKGLVGMDMQNLKSLEDAKIMDGLR
ncbi:hypothetical protein SUGI_0193660 [Cryptomeria japonica]|nr:hypothetical protein SUGI_0193660 [Cryptomeria japonica]